MTAPKKILCPVDFSQPSERAAAYAVDLAKATGGSVELLHVFQLPLVAAPETFSFPELVQTMSREADEGVAEMLKRHQGKGVTVTSVTTQGIPAAEIVRMAKEQNVDLVVIGTHGRTGLAHLLLGSVAERVMRTSPVPVLAVPHK